MNKKSKSIITFIISLIITFFIIGYLKSTLVIEIEWVEDVTIWQKFREYYLKDFATNFILAFIISIVPTVVVSLKTK